jgi:PAS domain S-box-containing protein
MLDALFSGGGELGELMAQVDWGRTSLGPVEHWPQSLRTCARIILTSRQPMFVWWGDELINLYNDAYKSIVGGKHPRALGQPAKEVWREIWDQIAPRAESAMRANEGTYDESLLLIMERYGYREETYYTFSYSPVPNDRGGTGGIICANADNTQRIIGERQVALLRELASRTADARTWREACRLSALSLMENPRDICFALIYMLDDSRKAMELAGLVRLPGGHEAAPEMIELGGKQAWLVEEAMRSHEIQLVRELAKVFPGLPGGAWEESPHTAAVVPLSPSGPMGRPGAVVVGLNPYRLPDDSYSGFLKLLGGQVSASIANAEAYEHERRRAETLAELDRAKTIFFSNISHEFRTPLTLMLGPLEDILNDGDPAIPAGQLQQIETVHRNGLRLLRLVNTLLDFSRIEAGRIKALYRPVELCSRTAELGSVFRSAMERAGLKYKIDCKPLPEPVYIDLDMWEKIVLNLLSNAFKFTLQGTVELTLRAVEGYAELSVRDTGIGIAETELPRIFERFHRIEGAVGRTHEGTGIGLALVDELVRLHGGTVEAQSVAGEGTTFTVRIPFGSAHLPVDRVLRGDGQAPENTLGAAPFVQEALRWLTGGTANEESLTSDLANEDLTAFLEQEREPAGVKRARVLLADDNRDMREYVQRLLARRYDVTAVADGEQALAVARGNPPDLVLTDVMMPRMDGFGLLRALRSESATAAIPVIMLSARAGEEAESEGLEAGADDYLVKPFTSRELMARVGSHISMHRLRLELTAREHELRTKAEAAEGQYRAMLARISEAFVAVDREWRITYANEQIAALSEFDVADLVGRDLWEVFPGLAESKFGRLYREAMESGEVTRLEEHYRPLDRWFHANAYPSPDGLSIFALDVTEKRIQQEKLLLSEKLAATGRLAATIAHEINNPLESVLNLIYLARISKAEIGKIREYLITAERELTRVSHIARHTLGFYRESSLPGDIDLPALIEEVLTVYESRVRGAGIEVSRDFAIVPAVHALRGELHQVFSNLISNAIDATRGDGALKIVVREAQENPGPGVVVTIQDTGVGIPAQNLPRLFEPFFTTKPNAGTGLGLWVVQQFVQSWGGTVSVNSTTELPDRGTRFTIFLPLKSVSEAQNKTNQASRGLM